LFIFFKFQIDIQFKMSRAVDFSFDLKYGDSVGDSTQHPHAHSQQLKQTTTATAAVYHLLKSTDYIKVKQFGYTISFTLLLPTGKYGNYLFTVYASDDSNKTKNLPAVYTYLIEYTTTIPTTNNNNNSIKSNSSASIISSSRDASFHRLQKK
jgi:hypothetical protein